MGGYGSTRWGLHWKAPTVEDAKLKLKLDSKVADIIRVGGGQYSLTWQGRAGGLFSDYESSIGIVVVEQGQAVRLQYSRKDSDSQHIDERVGVARVQLHYGARLFWVCPGCHRRAGVLYYRGGGLLSSRAGLFRCRQCHGLTYRSCQESDGRISAMVRQLERNPGGAFAAADAMAARGNFGASLLMFKALDKAMERNRRELRKLGAVDPWRLDRDGDGIACEL